MALKRIISTIATIIIPFICFAQNIIVETVDGWKYKINTDNNKIIRQYVGPDVEELSVPDRYQ